MLAVLPTFPALFMPPTLPKLPPRPPLPDIAVAPGVNEPLVPVAGATSSTTPGVAPVKRLEGMPVPPPAIWVS